LAKSAKKAHMGFFKRIKKIFKDDIKEDKYELVNDPIFGKIAKAKAPDSWVRTTCGYCGVGCGMYVGIKDGKAVYSKGDPKHPVNMGTLCPKGLSEHKMVEAPNRAKGAYIREDGELKLTDWKRAFELTSKKFKEIQEKYGKGAVAVISTGQLLTEEFYTLGKFVQLWIADK